MVNGNVNVKMDGKGADKIKADLANLLKMDVLVGVPEDKASREKDTKINNAQLMYIHTNGSPIQNIPARPVIEPAIKANKDKITNELQKAATLALDNKIDDAKKQLGRAGMLGQNVARGWFTDINNQWTPNAPSTIAKKESSNPLIDTGQLRKSITYVVRGDKK